MYMKMNYEDTRSAQKNYISIDDMSTLPIEDSVETGTSG